MTLTRFPAYLSLVPASRDRGTRREDEAPRVLQETWRPGERDAVTGFATRPALLKRLATIGELAPSAPLSFVIVRLDRLDEIVAEEGGAAGDSLLRAVAATIKGLTRATDAAGMLGAGMAGIVLQGTGATAAAAVAARISFHLGQLAVDGRRVHASVTVATGRGLNASMLETAAADSFGECG